MHKISSNSLFIGKKVVHLPKCHSTNSVAAELLAFGHAQEGTVVITDCQTAGRGQRGNKWESTPGENLTLSVVLKPDFLSLHQQFFLTIVSSLAVCAVVKEQTGQATIKWPNDVFVNAGKISGILIENTIRKNKIEACIVGIGLNVNQTRFSTELPTSLRQVTGNTYDLEPLLHRLCESLESFYLRIRAGRLEETRLLYLQHLMWLNEWRAFKDANGVFQGKITGITEGGKLIVEREEGMNVFDLKEVEYIY